MRQAKEATVTDPRSDAQVIHDAQEPDNPQRSAFDTDSREEARDELRIRGYSDEEIAEISSGDDGWGGGGGIQSSF